MIDVQKETKEKLKDIPADTVSWLFSVGLITEQAARRFLIVAEYTEAHPAHGEKEAMREQLADAYCVSTDTVKKYIGKKSN